MTTDHSSHVNEQIARGNAWYTASQFAWANKESVRRIYEKRYAYFKKIIDREILKKKEVALLDYGCGDGYWSTRLSQIPGCRVTGVDYNPLRLKRAAVSAPLAHFELADVSAKPLSSGPFDIVLCSQVIEHVKDDVSLLRHLQKLLVADGCLILGTPNEGCWTQWLRNRLHREETDHCHFYTEKEVRRKLIQTGFVVRDVFREVFFPGSDRLYYRLTSSDAGFRFLEWCTVVLPSQCSDYYFECTRQNL